MVEQRPGELNRVVLVAEAVSKEGPAAHVSVPRVCTVLQQGLCHQLGSFHMASVQDMTDHGEASVAVVVGRQVVTRVGRHQDPDQRRQGSKGRVL